MKRLFLVFLTLPFVLGQSECNELGGTFVLPGGVELVMLAIPAGTYSMGSTVVGGNATPVHSVTLTQAFQLGETEVTKAQWEAVMETTPWFGEDNVLDEPNTPATHVSWDDAQAFITALNTLTGETFRLPTEAEWEYGCRAGSTTEYYYGDSDANLGDYAWYSENSREFADFVAQKMPNDYGLFDTHGNVWELCEDWHDDEYYSDSPDTDPLGPETGTHRVIRGGSWFVGSTSSRSANRQRNGQTFASITIGFRLAK